jgi:NAD(P)-dependent dehydrogenase (short-subunit alcohol dehydrogenase family)
MRGHFSDRVVAITGASAGVGRAAALAFGREGATLALIARDAAALDATKAEIEAFGARADSFPLDIADADAVFAAAQHIEDRLGPIDIWVNNAMNSVFSPVRETTSEEYRRVMDVTFLGYVHGVQAALRHMQPRDRGLIIQVGSALAYRGIPLQSAYCAAKHAVQGFTDSLRTELLYEESGIRVTSVHLPALNTPQFRWVKTRLPNKAQPVPPIFQPELAADAIIFAVGSGRREVWVGWPTTQTIMGNRVAPWFVDRKLAEDGVSGQQTDEPYEERPHNLWEPVDDDEDYGAHGEFNDRASRTSLQFWATRNRGLLSLAGLGLAGLAGYLIADSARD